MKWFLIGFGILASLAAIGSTVTPSEPFNYEIASDEDRTVWLKKRSEEIGKGLSAGLKAAGQNEAQMALADTKLDLERKELAFIIEVKGSVRTAFPPTFTTDFQTQMCPVFRRSGLAKEDIKNKFQIVRSNGDVVRTDVITASVCDRLDTYKKRRKTS